MARAGLNSDQLDTILRDRVTIERYLDFRFRAFALVSAKEISDRYEKQYRPLRNSGRIVPTLKQVRDKIEHELTEEKIAEEIDKFVDNLRDGPGTEIVILNPSKPQLGIAGSGSERTLFAFAPDFFNDALKVFLAIVVNDLVAGFDIRP